MPRDLNQIFDLERLRRAWGDSGGASPSGAGPSPVVSVDSAPPLRLLSQLEDALAQEFGAQLPLFAYKLETIRRLLSGLLGEGNAVPRTAADLKASHLELGQRFNELEDLLDALSVPTPPA